MWACSKDDVDELAERLDKTLQQYKDSVAKGQKPVQGDEEQADDISTMAVAVVAAAAAGAVVGEEEEEEEEEEGDDALKAASAGVGGKNSRGDAAVAGDVAGDVGGGAKNTTNS